MPRPPERILLFRTGRHLDVALRALRAASPGCRIDVVTTAAAIPLLDEMGVDQAHRIIYDGGAFFHPWSFGISAAATRARRGRYQRVCVLWNTPDGAGQANVNRAALTVSLRGFTAITADGKFTRRTGRSTMALEACRAAWSATVMTAIALLLFVPARILRPFRA